MESDQMLWDMLKSHIGHILSETRRACIIHPTGTGKAFIAYRYAFDHPKERILWMSPSTYIEQEQEASIRRELPNYEFKNIERMTYQTAMHRAQKGNLDIHADTVIFDEFHHTGAPQWSRGVEGVIECNPDANLIGLSATSIRYSDSGRDMSDELFDGHIASYMSLTDCWVLGILPVPTYVTAGYSINGYIEDLGERIAKEESAGRRAELLADFNELRDCASRAANLPAIFQKYFEGIEKVIVFCPNVFELNEIEKMCPRWFSRVNGNVHTYPLTIHSELAYICQQYPICILVAVLYDTFGEMSVRLFFALLNMVAVLFIWYITFPKAGNRLLHCAVWDLKRRYFRSKR